MKTMIAVLLMLFSFAVAAQHVSFIRVYNKAGKKINKGAIISVTDSSLVLKQGYTTVDIRVNDIGYIKTKRSEGNNILVASSISAGALAIFLAATAEPNKILGYSAGTGVALGIVTGAPLGAVVGGITILFKNSKTFIINGDVNQWKKFQLATGISKPA